MAYSTQQYTAQAKIMQVIGRANHDDLCTVCHVRPRATWKDTGLKRMTCGSAECFIEWLPVKGLSESITQDQ